MIRLTYAALAGLLLWLPSAAAQTAPTTAGPVPAAVIEELVLASLGHVFDRRHVEGTGILVQQRIGVKMAPWIGWATLKSRTQRGPS
jgi:hypothetical protein